ncbi:hypothetical protein EV401DRAFT_1849838 [Pisolithus croceorrhizus]|nr:hypothetical protein EV401DRAFT_1849838 [Pisolithus croceorrhizus]
MVFRSNSRDVKLSAIRLYERGPVDLHDILDVCHLSEHTFYRILKLWREAGDVVNPQDTNKQGRPRLLHREDIERLIQLVRQKPGFFLDELLHLLQTNLFISVHFSVIHHEPERARMSHKKLKSIAMERNEEFRAEFIAWMAQ